MKHIKLFESFLGEGLDDKGKKAILNLIKSKYPKQYAAMEAEKGAEWMLQQMWGAEPGDTATGAMSDLIYAHYGETPGGAKEWKRGGQTESKVDRIVYDIYSSYVETDEPISFTQEEWEEEDDKKMSLNEYISEAVYAGVF